MVEIERDIEELLGVEDSLVPRRSSKHGINTHHKHAVFDPQQQGPIDGPPVEVFEHQLQLGEAVNGDDSNSISDSNFNARLFGGSHQIKSLLGKTQGSETLNGSSKMEFQVVSDVLPAEIIADHIVDDDSTPKSSLETDLESLEIPTDEITSIFSTVTSKTSNGDHFVAVNGYSNGTITPDESAVLQESKEDSVSLDIDVERVLKKQETHDLFCPNCNSCITKRVILRRRKRKIQEISPAEEIVIPEPPPQEPLPVQEIVEEPIEDTERDAFRCLSCFSIFIPIGRGFKIFGFGSRGSKETVRDASQPTTSDAPARVPEADPGTGEDQNLGVVTVQEQRPLHCEPELFPKQGGKPSLLPSASDKQDSMSLPPEKTFPTKMEGDDGNKLIDLNNISTGTGEDQHVGLVIVEEQNPLHSQPELLPKQGGKPSLLPSSSIKEEISMADDADTKLHPTKVDSSDLPAEKTFHTKLEADGGNKVLDVNNISGTVIVGDEVTTVPSTIGPQKYATEIENVDPGKQVVVTVVQQPDHTVVSVNLPTDTSAETEALLLPRTNTSTVPLPAPATDGEDPQIDIIKSVVYGGLLESIASLSVVTSAAGADAKTLNIVALGAANIFGGLFILAHNLRVLKHETSDERYEQVLGRPGHFTLHSTVAVLSYLVFGLLPPLIYGFTFRESDDRDYKLIAVALASLVCIIILSLGKSYARKPPTPKAYLKTLVYYLSLWIMVCGVSYVAGDLFDLLLRKLGLFESSSSVVMQAGEFKEGKRPWASS